MEARGVCKSYWDGDRETAVLKGVDLTLHAGELVAILGPSGSGKSTLLHLLGLMDSPTTGELTVLGQDLRELGEVQRARLRNRHVGFVFQFDSLLQEFNVLENVSLPGWIAGDRSPAEVEARAVEVLKAFGIEGVMGRLPLHLSGGERQRVAIARALLNRPALVLADEPTGNLDRRNAERVFAALREVSDRLGVAVVVVTHNEAAVGFASRGLHLAEGRLAASPEEEHAREIT